MAKVLYGLGDTLYRAGNIDKSKEACKESLEISREINNYKIELLALNRLGTIYTISDPEKSQKLLEDCLKLAREIGNRQMEIASLGNLGEVAANSRNDYQKALNYVEEALPVALELGDLRTLLIFELNSANYNISLGNVDEGREILTSGLNSINKLGSNAWALAGASVLARLYLFDGDQDKCMALLGLIAQNPATSSDVIEGVNLIIGEIKDQGISDNDIDLGMKAGEHLDLTDEIDDFLHSN